MHYPPGERKTHRQRVISPCSSCGTMIRDPSRPCRSQAKKSLRRTRPCTSCGNTIPVLCTWRECPSTSRNPTLENSEGTSPAIGSWECRRPTAAPPAVSGGRFFFFNYLHLNKHREHHRAAVRL